MLVDGVVPPSSLTVYVPGSSICEPEPPLPAFAATTVESILRSKRPESVAGTRYLVTVSLPLLRVFVIVQVTLSPYAMENVRDVPGSVVPLPESHSTLELYLDSKVP